MNTIAFEPAPEIAEGLEELCRVSGLEASELINVLLGPVVSQIFDERDSGLLRPIFQSFVYETKEEALKAIAGYERFAAGEDSLCYSDEAKVARTRDGHWKILFKSTHPDDFRAIYR